jgi:hypothetical protein
MFPPIFPEALNRKLIYFVPLESGLEKLSNCLEAPDCKALLAVGREG